MRAWHPSRRHRPRTYPEFPLRSGSSLEEYLPPLSKTLRDLAERYDTASSATLRGRIRVAMIKLHVPPHAANLSNF